MLLQGEQLLWKALQPKILMAPRQDHPVLQHLVISACSRVAAIACHNCTSSHVAAAEMGFSWDTAAWEPTAACRGSQPWFDMLSLTAGIRLAGATNDVHIFDIRTGTWAKIVPMGEPPSPRAAHAAAAVGNMVVVQVGGIKYALA